MQRRCQITDFGYLEALDDGKTKAKKAREAIDRLRTLLEPHRDKKRDDELAHQHKQRVVESEKSRATFRQRLDELKARYFGLSVSAESAKRGFELERLMYDMFELFDLDPKASFKNLGEQVDGAFALEGTDYLFEAKWQKHLVSIQSLDAFSGRVNRKLDNTLGVFLSINGFSPDGVAAHSTNRPSILLLDGTDIMAVLEERIGFNTLILRKKRHAAHTGKIYWPFGEMGVS